MHSCLANVGQLKPGQGARKERIYSDMPFNKKGGIRLVSYHLPLGEGSNDENNNDDRNKLEPRAQPAAGSEGSRLPLPFPSGPCQCSGTKHEGKILFYPPVLALDGHCFCRWFSRASIRSKHSPINCCVNCHQSGGSGNLRGFLFLSDVPRLGARREAVCTPCSCARRTMGPCPCLLFSMSANRSRLMAAWCIIV